MPCYEPPQCHHVHGAQVGLRGSPQRGQGLCPIPSPVLCVYDARALVTRRGRHAPDKGRATRTARNFPSLSLTTFSATLISSDTAELGDAMQSTLFNALVESGKAEAANFPFCTIEPNVRPFCRLATQQYLWLRSCPNLSDGTRGTHAPPVCTQFCSTAQPTERGVASAKRSRVWCWCRTSAWTRCLT